MTKLQSDIALILYFCGQDTIDSCKHRAASILLQLQNYLYAKHPDDDNHQHMRRLERITTYYNSQTLRKFNEARGSLNV